MARDWDFVARLRVAFERRLGLQVGTFMSAQAGNLADAYATGGLSNIGVRLRMDAPLLRRVLEIGYVASGNEMAARRLESLGVEDRFLDPQIARFARVRGAEQVRNINGTTRARVRAVIERAAIQKLTTREAAEAIDAALRGASRARSFQIARTEIGTATSHADILAARESGLDLDKTWTTAPEGERHPSAPGLDGQRRALDEPFDVRGFAMDRPLDPDGPASEVVNCRCAVVYRPRR